MNEPVQSENPLDKDERTWGMLCHLVALSGFVIPLGTILGPLIIWLIKKDEMPFVDDQGKEALNFQLSMLLGFIISAILMLVFIGVILMFILVIFDLVMIIVATIKANDGVRYRYPWAIRFLK